MILKQELINKIKDYFDLNVYETKVWLALLSKGIASAGEISEISGVPRSRTYDVLESLEKRGFALERLEKPVKYIGVKPNVILEKLKNNVKANAEEKVAMLSNIKETSEFEKLEEIYREGINPIKREDVSAAISGKSNIANFLKDLLGQAKEEVIICSNAREIFSKLTLFKNTISPLKKSKIEIKMALSGEEELIKRIASELKLEIKTVPIDAKFFIVDRKQILFYLSDTNTNKDSAIWLNSEFFSIGFASLFEKAIQQ